MNPSDYLRTITHPSAPRAERLMAKGEMEQLYHPSRSDMPGAGDVSLLVNSMKSAWDRQDPYVMEKGLGVSYGGPAGGSNNMAGMLTSTGLRNNQAPKPGEPKSIFVDERGVFGTVPGGFKRRPSMFGPEHLRMMVENTPLINAVILRRDRTIKRFLRPNERARDMKFEVRKADDLGVVRPKKGKEETLLESFLVHSGFEEDPRKMRQQHRDHLTTFVSKSVRDILTLDVWAIETVPTRNSRTIDGYHAIDGATIFLASEQGYMGDDQIIAVQVVNGLPYTTYTNDELIYAVMNPRSDVLHFGYGYAPPEMVVRVITGYLNAMTYNLKGFDSNAIPKGVLNIYGNFDEQQLEFFKCVDGDTQVWTTRGAMTIGALAAEACGPDTGIVQVAASIGEVWDGTAFVPALVARTGEKPTLQMTFEDGRQLTCSPDHQLLTLDPDGKLTWIRANQVTIDTPVAQDTQALDSGRTYRFTHGDVDFLLDESVWEYLGWLAHDGTVTALLTFYHWRKERHIRDAHAVLLTRLGLAHRLVERGTEGKKPVLYAQSPAFRDYLVHELGFSRHMKIAGVRLPSAVWQLTASCRRAYLRGAFSADGGYSGGTNITLTAVNRPDYLRDIQLLLGSLGIPSRIRNIRLLIRDARKFEAEIGFLHPHKTCPVPRHDGHAGRGQEAPASLTHRLAPALCAAAKVQWPNADIKRSNLRSLQRGGASMPRLRDFSQRLGVTDPALQWNYVKVVQVDLLPPRPMYDLSMRGPRPQFVANGLIVHNSQWNSMIRGVNNAWALPVMVSEDKESAATFTQLNEKFTDLYFAKWMVLLTSIVCSIYGMDPNEIYSEHFSAGKSSLSGSDAAERLAEARDTGLEPLMSYLEDTITNNILHRVASSDYVFRFIGIQPTDKERQAKVQDAVMTVKQLAEEYGIKIDSTEEWINAPINPSLQSVYTMAQQAKMGQPMNGFDGGSSGDAPMGGGEQDGQDDERPEGAQRKEDRTHMDIEGPEKASRDQQTFRKAVTGEILVIS